MGKPHHKWERLISVAPELKEYKIRLSRGWVRETTSKANGSKLLSEIVFDLGSELRSIELTASMPHTVVAQLDSFAEGFIRGAGETNAQQVARFIAARLVGKLDVRDPDLRDRILTECLQISTEIKPVRSVPGFSGSELWNEYLKIKGFQLALSATQALGIAAAYNSYETFLVRTVAAALGMLSYRKKSDENFQRKITEAFGNLICDTCFADQQVRLLRALRHAIAHNGCRETRELVDLQHPFHVVDRSIQLMPQHLTIALRIVEKCVTAVVDAAKSHKAFRKRP